MDDLIILHVSDLHCRDREVDEFRLRVSSLIRDLRSMRVRPDLVVVSGDIAFSGKPEQYELARDLFFSPLIDDLGIKPSQLLVAAGNHDVDRDRIDPLVRDGIAARLTDTETAQVLFEDPTWILPQEEGFTNFVGTLMGEELNSPSYARVHMFGRLKIGVAVLDSAWACTGDDSYQKVFLTRRQVRGMIDRLAGCDLRIAVAHHPLDWFHPSEQEIVQQDLRAFFDLLLIGHKHETIARSVTTPSTDCMELMASSLFEGRPEGLPDGYCLYRVSPESRRLDATFRKWIRGRSRYDMNVEYAPQGEASWPLPSTAFADTMSIALARTVSAEEGLISERMLERLKRAQDLPTPILLTPPVDEMKWVEGEKKYSPLTDPYGFAAEHSCIVYGAPDTGTSMYLEELAHRIHQDPIRMCVYVDHEAIASITSGDALIKWILEEKRLRATDLDGAHLSVIVDHVRGAEADRLETLLGFSDAIPHLVICVKNAILFDTFAGATEQEALRFLKVRHWGPSRLRKFTTEYLRQARLSVDADAAYKFIADSLSLSDLPVTPFLVALYLRVWLELGGALTGLSFVQLLERLEVSSLDKADATTVYDIYNLRMMLAWLAQQCYEAGELGISRQVFESHIASFFEECNLDVDPARFVELIESSGILVFEDDGNVSFSCLVFFNYYLAQAIEAGRVDRAQHLKELHTALQLGDALAYYAGRHRDEETLATELMRCLEEQYTPRENIDSAYLEEYISRLLTPEHPVEQKDAVTKEAVEGSVDYEAEDHKFRESQHNYRTLGKILMHANPPQDKVERVAWNIVALKTFYNVLRNLVHIPGDSKIELLDRILDFHLHCNMDLIDLFTESMDDDGLASLCAYMVTMGGEAFLSKNVGAASMQRTIDDLLGKTTNDLKAFLLHCIYADLRLPGYAGRLQAFVASTDSVAMTEMLYVKIYGLLVTYEGGQLPAELISAFSAVFDKRQQFYGKVTPVNLQQSRDRALNRARTQHLVRKKDLGSE